MSAGMLSFLAARSAAGTSSGNGAFTGVAAIGATLATTTYPAYADGTSKVVPAPKPIPGGTQISVDPPVTNHKIAQATLGVTLPYTGVKLEGLDVEPSLITDRTRFTPPANHAEPA